MALHGHTRKQKVRIRKSRKKKSMKRGGRKRKR